MLKPVDWYGVLALCKGRKIATLNLQTRQWLLHTTLRDIADGAILIRSYADNGRNTFEVSDHLIAIGSDTPTHIYNVPHTTTDDNVPLL